MSEQSEQRERAKAFAVAYAWIARVLPMHAVEFRAELFRANPEILDHWNPACDDLAEYASSQNREGDAKELVEAKVRI